MRHDYTRAMGSRVSGESFLRTKGFDMDVEGKSIMVTGASAGIGEATGKKFARAGARVAFAARSREKLESLAEMLTREGCKVIPIIADMRSRNAVVAMVEHAIREFGTLDVLINNAGQSAAGAVADVNIDDFRQILDLNIFGVLYAIQAVVPKMREQGGGMIVNVSSMVSRMRLPGLGAYAATKAALNVISDTARVELERDNIRVLTIFPRMTSTNFGRNALGDQHLRQQQRASAPRTGAIVDTPEFVADRIFDAVRGEMQEQFMDGQS